MNEARVVTISHGDELPEMVCTDFFHSSQFFRTLEQAPGIAPYMVIALDAQKCVVAHMLIVIVTHHSVLPPFFIRHGHVYGEGEYDINISNKEEIFNTNYRKMPKTKNNLKKKLF